MIGLGIGVPFSRRGGGRTWYVRPSGGSYGDEDGTSYATAWDGFTNIAWGSGGITSGDTLYVCGTHTETLTVGVSGITIRGDYDGDAGVIDSEDTRDKGLIIDDFNNITLESITSIDAVISCVEIGGTSTGIVTNDLIVTGSGNQGVQHLETCSVTHNNITATGNVDDGVSGHGSCTIILNGGTIHSNDDGINCVGSVHITADGIDFSTGNTSYDVYTSQADSAESVVIDISNSTIPGNVYSFSNSKIILRNCSVAGTTLVQKGFSDSSYIEAHNCVLSGELQMWEDTNGEFDNCLILDIWGSGFDGDVTFTGCYIKDRIYAVLDGVDAVFTRCLFDGDGQSNQMVDVKAGATATFNYCIVKNIPSGKFFALLDESTGTGIMNNCTFIGASNVGRGLFIRPMTTINNCIFTDLEIGYFEQGDDTHILNNCCLYDNTTDVSGSATQNDSQTSDPILKDISINDFSLDTGSSCIGNGKDLGDSLDEGIDTADWGNGTSEAPEVTTKEQNENWDIGAYVS